MARIPTEVITNIDLSSKIELINEQKQVVFLGYTQVIISNLKGLLNVFPPKSYGYLLTLAVIDVLLRLLDNFNKLEPAKKENYLNSLTFLSSGTGDQVVHYYLFEGNTPDVESRGQLIEDYQFTQDIWDAYITTHQINASDYGDLLPLLKENNQILNPLIKIIVEFFSIKRRGEYHQLKRENKLNLMFDDFKTATEDIITDLNKVHLETILFAFFEQTQKAVEDQPDELKVNVRDFISNALAGNIYGLFASFVYTLDLYSEE